MRIKISDRMVRNNYVIKCLRMIIRNILKRGARVTTAKNRQRNPVGLDSSSFPGELLNSSLKRQLSLSRLQ